MVRASPLAFAFATALVLAGAVPRVASAAAIMVVPFTHRFEQPVLTSIVTPTAGAEAEAEVGQPMVVRATMAETATYFLDQPRSASEGRSSVTVPSGAYGQTGVGPGGVFYAPAVGGTITGFFGIVDVGVFLPTKDGAAPMLFTRALGATAARTFPAPGLSFTVTKRSKPSGLRTELVYGGVAKGVVSILYREFKDDYARPAFSQALTYDLADGDEIGFRGARLKVLKATNTSIGYVVIKLPGEL